MIKATARARALLIVSAALVAAAFITPASAAPVPAATAIFLVILLVVSRASLNAQLGVLDSLRVKRIVSKPLISGREAVISVVFKNESSVPLEFLEVKIPYPKVFKLVSGEPVTLISIPPRSEVSVSIKVVPRVGTHVLDELRVVLRDFLGLHRYEASLLSKEVIRVYPKVVPVKALAITYASRAGELSRARRKGRGVEFYGVREYVPGDEYRRIEWKASARFGLRRLFVKEFEHEVSLNIFIIIDTSPYMLSGGWGRTPLEYSINAAASIASYALRRGDSIAVIHRFVKMPSLVRGRKALNKVIDDLSSVSWSDIISGEGGVDLKDLMLNKLAVALPRERNVIIIFTVLYGGLEDAKRIADASMKLIEMGNAVMVIVPMVEFFEARTLEGLEAAIYRLRSYGAVKGKMEGIKYLISRGIPTVTALPEELADIIIARLEGLRSARI